MKHHVENVMNSREINSRGWREEGQDYVEDDNEAREEDTQLGQDYLDDDDDDGSGFLNKVMNSEEIFHNTTTKKT